MDDEEIVTIMDANPSDGDYIRKCLYDEASGEYRTILPPENEKAVIKIVYMRNTPNASEEAFEAAWPRIWTLTDYPYAENSQPFAVIDSGIMQGHPLLKDCIRETVDFTGEGIDDAIGHGTVVALQTRLRLPGVPRNQLIVLKAVGADGGGKPANLVAALKWILDYNSSHEVKIQLVNVSLGVYSKSFGFIACRGNCEVCTMAKRVASEGGCMVVAAAGNKHGKTSCPATAGLHDEACGIIAVAVANADYSGTGTVAMALQPRYETIPVQ